MIIIDPLLIGKIFFFWIRKGENKIRKRVFVHPIQSNKLNEKYSSVLDELTGVIY